MQQVNDLSLLTCGQFGKDSYTDSRLVDIISHICRNMDLALNQIVHLFKRNTNIEQQSLFGPYLGRSLLELSATALIGRLDPMRLLTVRHIQTQPHYDATLRWRASIQWQGDVVATEKVKDLWSEKIEPEKMTRALLGDYYDQIFWRPAFQRMTALSPTGGRWMAQLLNTDPDSFIGRKKDELGRLYSALSKGVHHEFLTSPGSRYDPPTVLNLTERTIQAIADLGMISHFIPHLPFSLPHKEVIDTFNRIENMEIYSA